MKVLVRSHYEKECSCRYLSNGNIFGGGMPLFQFVENTSWMDFLLFLVPVEAAVAPELLLDQERLFVAKIQSGVGFVV